MFASPIPFGGESYTGKITGYRLTGNDVTAFGIDTDGDGNADKVANVNFSPTNTLRDSLDSWEESGEEVTWEDADGDCNYDMSESIGPDL